MSNEGRTPREDRTMDRMTTDYSLGVRPVADRIRRPVIYPNSASAQDRWTLADRQAELDTADDRERALIQCDWVDDEPIEFGVCD